MSRLGVKPKRVVCAVCGRTVAATVMGSPRAHKEPFDSAHPQPAKWCRRKLTEDAK